MSENDASVEGIFHETRMRPVEERDGYLDAVCGSNAALRARVEALLDADARNGDLLAAPVLGPAEEPGEGPGDRIGPYKLLQLIGEGGFGAVYMAEQEVPLRRRVALSRASLARPGLVGHPFGDPRRWEGGVIAGQAGPVEASKSR